jgi:hypothetical protein
MNRRLIFIHVPKTAGLAVRSVPWVGDFGHLTLRQVRDDLAPEGFAAAFKFAFVRNPFARLVSAYSYFQQMPPDDPYFAVNQELIRLVRCFVSFSEFVQHLETAGVMDFYHFWPQARFVTLDGRLGLDWLGGTERLQAGFNEVARRLGQPAPRLPRLNHSRHAAWESFYTSRTLATVARLYAEDFPLVEMAR